MSKKNENGKAALKELFNSVSECMTADDNPELIGQATQYLLAIWNLALDMAKPLVSKTFESTLELGRIFHTVWLLHDFEDKELGRFLREFTAIRVDKKTALQYIGRYRLWKSLPASEKGIVGLMTAGTVDFFAKRRDVFDDSIGELSEMVEKAKEIGEDGLPLNSPEKIREKIRDAGTRIKAKHTTKEEKASSSKPADVLLTGPFASLVTAMQKVQDSSNGEQLRLFLESASDMALKLEELMGKGNGPLYPVEYSDEINLHWLTFRERMDSLIDSNNIKFSKRASNK